MPDIIATIFVALIGGAVVFITTGPALGATRSRKAVRELLEIRGALEPSDRKNQRKIREIVDREVLVLEAMGDTQQRLANSSKKLALGLIALGLMAAVTTIFIPSERLQEPVLYFSAVLLLLAAIALLVATPYEVSIQTTRWAKVGAWLVTSAGIAILLGMAVLIVSDTSYMGYLLEFWENPGRL